MKNHRRKKETSVEDTHLYDKVTQLQTAVIEKLSGLRKNNKNYACQHLTQIKDIAQQYDGVENYYVKFWKLYLSAQLCRDRVRTVLADIGNTQAQIEKIQNIFERLQSLKQQRSTSKAKVRRKADDIQKKFQCHYEGCYKTYGTQPALRLHFKQKHFSIDQFFNQDF